MAKHRSSYRKKRSVTRSKAAMILAAITMAVLVISMARTCETDKNGAATIDEAADLTYVRPVAGIPLCEIDYEGFRVAFNPALHIPNYVAWTLTDDRTDGPHKRSDASFRSDDRVDGSASPDDYRRSGFDRGHMAPAADMKWSSRAMSDCHYMTNICPQDKRLNAGAWATTEKLCRNWARRYGRVIIVCGPVVTDRITRHIGRSRVAVPERFFKVVLAPEADPPRGIGFIMPNGHIDGGAEGAVTSIDRVEALTGWDFFSALPDEIESQVESQTSIQALNRGKRQNIRH